jgi:hypothetical protein
MKLAQSNVQRVEHLAATPIATTQFANFARPISATGPSFRHRIIE